MKPFFVELAAPAGDMAAEEIGKQIAFLSPDIREVRFSGDGRRIDFSAPADQGEALCQDVKRLAQRIERALRNVQRKVLFQSSACGRGFASVAEAGHGVTFLGTGQVALHGIALRLFRYFDREFEAFGDPWRAEPLLTPTLIPSGVLARCDYFRSFPNTVTFAAHLHADVHTLDGFRARHEKLDELDGRDIQDMDPPEACLSPAVCYHVYHLNRNSTAPAAGLSYGICGKCFRYESSNLSDLRRLWDFTMREVVFLGAREQVLEHRERSIQMMGDFLERHALAGEIRTASDPFFIAPDAVSKTYFQLSSESKFEVSLMLPDEERVAVGSHNYHSDFFGRAFDTQVEGGGPMHSVCVAFGLERWVHAFLQQHGADPACWPAVMRGAPEFAGLARGGV